MVESASEIDIANDK